MRLAEWLHQERVKRSHFALRIGISVGHVSELCNEKVLPSLALAAKIKRVSSGAVDLEDWRTDS